MNIAHSRHAGTSLVELILFLAFFAIAGSVVISILFSTNEQRIYQRTILNVERTGVQLLQVITRHVQHAERVLDPPAGFTGSILALSVAVESNNPTMIATQSGYLLIILHDTTEEVPHTFPLEHFSVRNTSPSAGHPSILVSFDVSIAIPLPSAGSRIYTRHFERFVPLLPDDYVTGDDCGCDPPACVAGLYRWEVCDGELCTPSTATVHCAP